MSSTQKTPWSNLRQVLWLVGVLGLLFVAIGCLLDWLFGGLRIGGAPPEPHREQWMFFLVIAAVSLYYIIVAQRGWNRRLWIIGIVLHSIFLLMLFAGIVVAKISGVAALPLFLVGPVVWGLYAKRQKMSNIVV